MTRETQRILAFRVLCVFLDNEIVQPVQLSFLDEILGSHQETLNYLTALLNGGFLFSGVRPPIKVSETTHFRISGCPIGIQDFIRSIDLINEHFFEALTTPQG